MSECFVISHQCLCLVLLFVCALYKCPFCAPWLSFIAFYWVGRIIFSLYRNAKLSDTYVSGVILTLSMLIFELSLLTLVNNHTRIRKSNAFAEISSPGQIYRTFFTFILHLTWLVQSTTCMYHSYSSSQSK